MTKRKSDMARVAKALGLPLVPGETTSELADRCEERAAELSELASGAGEHDEEADDREPEPEAKPARKARKRSKRGEGQGRQRAERGSEVSG